jgi:hypothetical protein
MRIYAPWWPICALKSWLGSAGLPKNVRLRLYVGWMYGLLGFYTRARRARRRIGAGANRRSSNYLKSSGPVGALPPSEQGCAGTS